MRRLLVAVFTFALTACGGPDVVTVPVAGGSARLSKGEILSIKFGEVNGSVGDSWYLVSPPDPAVLTERDRDFASHCDNPGCGATLAWTFTATGAGSTTLVFQYCYRSQPANCAGRPGTGRPDPTRLAVTVT